MGGVPPYGYDLRYESAQGGFLCVLRFMPDPHVLAPGYVLGHPDAMDAPHSCGQGSGPAMAFFWSGMDCSWRSVERRA